MRALDCFCRERLKAVNDEELLDKVRVHVAREHPDMGLDDEQVGRIVAQGAHDKPEELSFKEKFLELEYNT